MWDDFPAAYAEECRSCGSTIAAGSGFCAECGARRPPRATPAPSGSYRRPWIIAGVLAGGIAAIAIGAVLAVALTGRGEVGLASATASVSPSIDPGATSATSPSTAPSSEPALTPTPVPTPPPNPELANRSIADVQVDQLNLRVAGNESAEVLGQLRAGARVFTIGAPEATGATYWYRVAVASGPYSGEADAVCSGGSYCEPQIGWVASPITGDPWLETVDIGCPASPMTIDQLESLMPLERLHCYGSADITVTGTITHPCCGFVGPVRYEPAWLALPGSSAYFNGTSVMFRTNPSSSLEPPERGDVIEATAHHEDPASPSCRQSLDPEYADNDIEVATTASAVLSCRTQLVVTDYEVVGTEDLGPCCGAEPATRQLGRVTPPMRSPLA
jgi:hypothetical protein